jgi:hypothetical protein
MDILTLDHLADVLAVCRVPDAEQTARPTPERPAPNPFDASHDMERHGSSTAVEPVKDSLSANQDDQLIIEGYPVMQGTQHVLLAQSCVSMLQQRAQKQTQQQMVQQQAETTS